MIVRKVFYCALCLLLALSAATKASADQPIDPMILLTAMSMQVKTELCTRDFPNLAEQLKATYAALLASFELPEEKLKADPRFEENMEKIREHVIGKHNEASALRVALDCEEMAEGSPPSAPPDPKYSSPEKTWHQYISALKQADKRAAAHCLTGRARVRFTDLLSDLPTEKVKKMGDAVEAFWMKSQGETIAEGFIGMKNGRGGSVQFIRNHNGEWLISDM